MSSANPLQEDLDHIIRHSRSVWQNTSGSKIFLTGGTGFFGKWLLESFAWANEQFKLNAQIHVLSRNPDGFKLKAPHLNEMRGIFFHQGDVKDFRFPTHRFDYIIHAATDTDARSSEEVPLATIDTIVTGTRRVLEFSLTCGAKRVLLTSSGAVYGKQPPKISHVSEDYFGAPDASLPSSSYGEAKRLAEVLCSIFHEKYNLETTIARCFAFVGPYLPLDIHFAIGNFIRDVLEKKAINVLGDGTVFRSYLYTADLAIWLWTILFRGHSGRIYNVGSNQEISIAELADKISTLSDSKSGVVISKTPVPGRKPARYVPNIDRAERELGLRCWIGLDEAINRTIRFYEKTTW